LDEEVIAFYEGFIVKHYGKEDQNSSDYFLMCIPDAMPNDLEEEPEIQ
jgi:hypothetical protein